MECELTDLIIKMGLDGTAISYFEGASFTMTSYYHQSNNLLELSLRLKRVLPYRIWDRFIMRFKKFVRCEAECHIISEHTDTNIFEVFDYIKHYVSLHREAEVFINTMPVLEDTYIVYRINEEAQRDTAIQNKHLLIQFLRDCGFQLNILIKENKKAMEEAVIPAVKAITAIKAKAQPSIPESKPKRRSRNKKLKPLDQYQRVSINQINQRMPSVSICGKIFDAERREVRFKKNPDKLYVIQNYWICDDDDTIIMKRFLSKKQAEEQEPIRKGATIIAYGDVIYDKYADDYVFKPHLTEEIAEVERCDEASEKRVELHVHTKLSEMDGVCDIEEFIETANSWGMDAIAISDHMVAQAFPKAQAAVSAINKKRDPNNPFKMIYGVEFNMVDPYLHIVRNANDTILEKGTYCVFDLETTGLSSRFDHIIEFGAQIVKDRSCIKSMQMFIKPPVEISAFTTVLTGITSEHLKDARPFEECVDELLEFIGDSILVAHNANFDYNFLNDSLIRANREPLTNPVIDTLDLARSLQSDRKGYRLVQIARRYGIRYDEEVAHRADYDAEVLALTFLNMMNDLKHIETLYDLQNMQDSSCFKKVNKKSVVVMAKNMAGLKELFELVTLSHTKYLSYNAKNTNNVVGEPRILRQEIEKRRLNGNLLIGSGSLNGEVFDMAHKRGKEQLLEVMRFYDYIEIQPLENYRHLVERDSIGSQERLKEILSAIIAAADELGKPIVATGDCHYVHPKQKQIRDIYINSQPIGGVRHPLYIYNSEKRRRFQTPDQHFYTTEEMLEAFEWTNRAHEFVIENTNKIKDQIGLVLPVKERLHPPERGR